MSEIDVSRDLMDFQFIMRSDDESNEKLQYYLELVEWEIDHLSIFVNFTDPTLISKGL